MEDFIDEIFEEWFEMRVSGYLEFIEDLCFYEDIDV